MLEQAVNKGRLGRVPLKKRAGLFVSSPRPDEGSGLWAFHFNPSRKTSRSEFIYFSIFWPSGFSISKDFNTIILPPAFSFAVTFSNSVAYPPSFLPDQIQASSSNPFAPGYRQSILASCWLSPAADHFSSNLN